MSGWVDGKVPFSVSVSDSPTHHPPPPDNAGLRERVLELQNDLVAAQRRAEENDSLTRAEATTTPSKRRPEEDDDVSFEERHAPAAPQE